MFRTDRRISLANLAEAGIRLRISEAVTIVRDFALRVARRELSGVPSPAVIHLSTSGTLSVDGPVVADQDSVARATQLLERLLEMSATPREDSIRSALELVLLRGRGAEGVATYPSLESFAHALSLFAVADVRVMVSDLTLQFFARNPGADERPNADSAVGRPPIDLAAVRSDWCRPRSPSTNGAQGSLLADAGPLTISDIRRARRATGLTLDQVATGSRIPVALLRQLE